MKKMKLFPKIFLFTFTMMLLISIIAHLLIFLIAPSQNVLVTNMVVTNISDFYILLRRYIGIVFILLFQRHNHSDFIALKIRKSNVEIGARRKSDCIVKG